MKTGQNELDYRSEELCQNQYTNDSLKMESFCTGNLGGKKINRTGTGEGEGKEIKKTQ